MMNCPMQGHKHLLDELNGYSLLSELTYRLMLLEIAERAH